MSNEGRYFQSGWNVLGSEKKINVIQGLYHYYFEDVNSRINYI